MKHDITGITPEMVRAQFVRNAQSLLLMAEKARAKGGKYNGATEQFLREKAAIYSAKAGK